MGGAVYGAAKMLVGISSMDLPEGCCHSMIPVLTAGALGLYGVFAAVTINGKLDAGTYSAFSAYSHLAAGLTVGLSSLAAGLAIGIVVDASVRANAQRPKLFIILIFAHVLALFGFYVGLLVASTNEGKGKNLCSDYAAADAYVA